MATSYQKYPLTDIYSTARSTTTGTTPVVTLLRLDLEGTFSQKETSSKTSARSWNRQLTGSYSHLHRRAKMLSAKRIWDAIALSMDSAALVLLTRQILLSLPILRVRISRRPLRILMRKAQCHQALGREISKRCERLKLVNKIFLMRALPFNLLYPCFCNGTCLLTIVFACIQTSHRV